MTRTQAQIIELFQTLAADEQKALAAQLHDTAAGHSFLDAIAPEQYAQVEAAIGEASRGEGMSAIEFFSKMVVQHGYKRAP